MPNSFSTYPGSIMLKEGKYGLPFEVAAILDIASVLSFYIWFIRVKLLEETSSEAVITLH